MKLRIERSVVVITPTVARPSLTQAIQSVSNQTYKNLIHLIVIDGPEYFEEALKLIAINKQSNSNIVFTTAPFNTGGDGFYGHRIYAGYSHLVNQDYVAFLDEDNWFEPNHIQSLVEELEKNDYNWVHSLRKVYVNDDYLADDCCESIGRWPIWFSPEDAPQHLVDTSSYMFERDFLSKVANHWHWGWGGDRRFYTIITKGMGVENNYGTTGLHTLNYRLPDMNKAYGGDFKFFEKGNAAILQKYNGVYPWKKI